MHTIVVGWNVNIGLPARCIFGVQLLIRSAIVLKDGLSRLKGNGIARKALGHLFLARFQVWLNDVETVIRKRALLKLCEYIKQLYDQAGKKSLKSAGSCPKKYLNRPSSVGVCNSVYLFNHISLDNSKYDDVCQDLLSAIYNYDAISRRLNILSVTTMRSLSP